jgi:hypothetical protein
MPLIQLWLATIDSAFRFTLRVLRRAGILAR